MNYNYIVFMEKNAITRLDLLLNFELPTIMLQLQFKLILFYSILCTFLFHNFKRNGIEFIQ